jgi:ribonuclease BN (tRNA processing enzyme)
MAAEARADLYMTKPFNVNEMSEAIRALMDGVSHKPINGAALAASEPAPSPAPSPAPAGPSAGEDGDWRRERAEIHARMESLETEKSVLEGKLKEEQARYLEALKEWQRLYANVQTAAAAAAAIGRPVSAESEAAIVNAPVSAPPEPEAVMVIEAPFAAEEPAFSAAPAPPPAELRLESRGRANAGLKPVDSWRLRLWSAGGLPPDCISFRHKELLVILDAGDGLASLVRSLEEEERENEGADAPKEVWLFLSHTHPRHIRGLEHAAKLIHMGRRVHVVGPGGRGSVVDRLLWLLPQSERAAVHSVGEGAVGGVPAGLSVTALYTMHPAPCLAYRFSAGDKSFVFACDDEIPLVRQEQSADHEVKMAKFCAGADLLIHDARFSDQDYPKSAGEGHSCPTSSLRMAQAAEVRKLLLYHLDERYGPGAYADFCAAHPECLEGQGGMTVDVP